MKRGIAVIPLLAVLAALVWHLQERHSSPRSPGASGWIRVPAPAPPSQPAPPAAASVAVSAAAGGEPADQPSRLADRLNSSSGDIHADLRLLNDIFMHYRSAVHGDNPIGDNAEIAAALTGRNRLGFAFIPKDHPAINSRGELCDRWGTPYFFHQLSADEMEIRSAGPDRKMWTADDEVLTPGF